MLTYQQRHEGVAMFNSISSGTLERKMLVPSSFEAPSKKVLLVVNGDIFNVSSVSCKTFFKSNL